MAERFVLKDIKVTKIGNRNPDVNGSSLSTRVDPKGGPSGTAKPKINGPKRTDCSNQAENTPESKTARTMMRM